MNVEAVRAVLGPLLGRNLTPEVAAHIEVSLLHAAENAIDPGQFAPRQFEGLTFAVESMRAVPRDEIHPLHAAHYTETEKYRQQIAMDADWEAFEASERAGRMLYLTARDSGGQLVGHIRMYVDRSTHTKQPVAREDVFFLLPVARRGFTAIRFWQYMEECLVQLLGGVQVTTDSKKSNGVGRLNKYLGYEHVADVWVKFLKRKEAANVQ